MSVPATENKYLNIVPPAAIVDDASFTTAEIDTKGFEYLTVICALGATDIAAVALKLQECDTTGGSFSDVTGLVFGTSTDIDGVTSILPTATDDNGLFVFEVALQGRKRFLDLVATAGNGAAGTYLAVTGILSRAKVTPTTVAGHGAAGLLRL